MGNMAITYSVLKINTKFSLNIYFIETLWDKFKTIELIRRSERMIVD